MRIGIVAEGANLAKKTGVEHYAKQIIIHLGQVDQENEYILYLRTEPESWFSELPKNFSAKVIPFPAFWTQARISLEMLLHPVDVLFAPASPLPFIHPRRSYATVFDLAWHYYPENYTSEQRRFLGFFTWFMVKFSAGLLSISEATKQDLIRFYKADPAKVSVTHLGYDPISPHGARPAGLPEKFALFLSTLQPRKNLERLIDAFNDLKRRIPSLPHKLVIVGKPGWKYDSILQKIEAHPDTVRYVGYVDDATRFAILRQADLLVLPSLYEGFGIPILEAFNARVPVATSNISSMPEVAGDAAAYFDPLSTQEISAAMERVLLEPGLRESLIEKGTARLADFSWEKCARETLDILEGGRAAR